MRAVVRVLENVLGVFAVCGVLFGFCWLIGSPSAGLLNYWPAVWIVCAVAGALALLKAGSPVTGAIIGTLVAVVILILAFFGPWSLGGAWLFGKVFTTWTGAAIATAAGVAAYYFFREEDKKDADTGRDETPPLSGVTAQKPSPSSDPIRVTVTRIARD